MAFDRRHYTTSREELMRIGMIDPGPVLVTNRPTDRGPPRRHWRENFATAVAYLRELQEQREQAEQPHRSVSDRGAERHLMERLGLGSD